VTETDPRHRAINADIAALNAIDWIGLGLQLHTAIESSSINRDLRPWETPITATPDGFPTTASGSDAGGGGTGTTASSVERAAAARTDRRDDPTATAIRSAMMSLTETVQAVRACRGHLVALATERDASERASIVPGCWALARVGGWEEVHAVTVIAGITYPLGRWAYDFQRRIGLLPTVAQCKLRVEGRKVYAKAPR
jgi:hypothetical protein